MLMMAISRNLGSIHLFLSRYSGIMASCPRLLCSSSVGVGLECGRALSADHIFSQNNEVKLQDAWKGIETVCQVLEGSSWGPPVEHTLSTYHEKPNPTLVIGVLKRLKDVEISLNYFRWVERRTGQVHCPEAYDMLLIVISRSKKYEKLEEFLEEMSLAGYGPSINTTIE